MENKENIIKKQNGSVALIVLFSMVFMVSYMLIMYASNINREKTLIEQTEFIKDLYSPKGTDEEIYERAYANLREKNKKTYSQSVENSNIIKLNQKAYGGEIDELKIYGSGYDRTDLEWNNLPDEYQEVEYIESTWTQYIDTGVQANTITQLNGKFKLVEISEVQGIFGGGWTSNESTFQGINYAGKINFKWKSVTSSIDHDLEVHVFELSSKRCIIDNKVINEYDLGNIEEDKRNIRLFCRNSDNLGSGIQQYSKIRIYYMKLYENEKLVRNFIPCYNKSDNVIGMYDTVEGKFYENQGTGEFLKGENSYNYTKEVSNNKSIGTLVDNVSDTNYVKYLIPIKVTGENAKTVTYNIYLEQPLRKYGDAVDYLDIKTKKVYRNVGFDENQNTCKLEETIIENVEIPEIKLYEDEGSIEILTENISTKIEVTYIGYNIE